jgi:hypothetical protein
MCDLTHLGHAVRDVDDGGSRLDRHMDATEQQLGRFLVKRRRRLVENEDLRSNRERLRDLEQLLLRNGEFVASFRQRDVEADIGEDATCGRFRGLSREQPVRQSDLQVLED